MVNLVFPIALIVLSQVFIGDTFEIEPRVVRGYTGRTGQFPYYALLVVQPFQRPGPDLVISRCGATLISDTFLVTAAHCLVDAQKVLVHLGISQTIQREREHTVIPVGRENFHFPSEYRKTQHWIDMGLYTSIMLKCSFLYIVCC